ncbi:MAG: exodeoxyribonuclease I, partial [Comamonas sp.]
AHRVATLMQGEGGARTFDALFAQLDALGEQADERAGAILEAIYDYAEAIAPDMG